MQRAERRKADRDGRPVRSCVRNMRTRADDIALREAMTKVASERRRFGYRRIHVILERQGIVMMVTKEPENGYDAQKFCWEFKL